MSEEKPAKMPDTFQKTAQSSGDYYLSFQGASEFPGVERGADFLAKPTARQNSSCFVRALIQAPGGKAPRTLRVEKGGFA